MTRRVLHPAAFSRTSAPAFAASLAEARKTHGELVLVHVLSPVSVNMAEVNVRPVGGD